MASTDATPQPIRGCKFQVPVNLWLTTGLVNTGASGLDSEVSVDSGGYSDCANEATEDGSSGSYTLELTGAEMNGSHIAGQVKSSTTNAITAKFDIFPLSLPSISTGTLSAGSSGGGTLGTLLTYDITGCFIATTGGTGGGGTGGANNQARKIVTYNVSTGAFTVGPVWGTTPDNTTTYSILLPPGMTLGALKALNPATAGRTLAVDSSGVASSNLSQILGTALTETAGLLAGGFKKFFNVSAPTGTLNSLPGAVAGAANGLWILGVNNTAAITIGNLTTSAIACTTITASGAVSFQSAFDITGAMTVSGGITADIAGTIASVTTLSNLPSIPVNWITATGIAANAITSAKFAAGTTIPRVTLADTVTTVTGLTASNLDATISSRLAASSYTAAPSAATISTTVWGETIRTITGGTIGTYTGNTPQTGDSYARIGATGSGLTSLATSAQAVKLLAATYDSATLSGSTMTLSNAATMTVSSTGRVTT